MHDHISVEVTMLSEVDNLEKNPLVITRWIADISSWNESYLILCLYGRR